MVVGGVRNDRRKNGSKIGWIISKFDGCTGRWRRRLGGLGRRASPVISKPDPALVVDHGDRDGSKSRSAVQKSGGGGVMR
ncbi:hypothetical protein L3X38_012628 [Prunus dulcis]|uniref:Uncharacterized protein n=1 Tax=Prunus dulcis TaxID=3755 RepID=A0AAD4ZGK3_PRUDU|nr:hypothetical protein L3X38_012628 [Prunus dulcis]